ncbi:MAG: UDP-N-acetylmuramoyl-L-alanine--D-glutamate ligase [Rhodospirillaceae bacterium]|nr:UDP-N-acetylmuramoyl-L-alanine--D-glutamate ligase [Rhodospirillaceae bacterium]
MKFKAEGNRTLVVGLGATGLSVARFLAECDEDVLVIDSRPCPPGLEHLQDCFPKVQIVLENLDSCWLEHASRVILSPGLSLAIPIVKEARRLGIPIVSDIDLFFEKAEAPVIAVTGSNGKSTVVTLLERALSATGKKVAAGGNLGPPALDILSPDTQIYVLEISSFQMETTDNFHPKAAAVLNISPDHLDRHGSLDNYVFLKSKLAHDAKTLIYNWDDKIVKKMGQTHAQSIPFSVREKLEVGYSSIDSKDGRWLCKDGVPVLQADELTLPGMHNEANALAALALVSVVEKDHPQPQLQALREFSGLPHRCQLVAESEGILFVNDSKGTNVGATVAALKGFSGPLVLIAGGQSKDADFFPLLEAAQDRLVGLVAIGQSAIELETVFKSNASVLNAASMKEAVANAIQFARHAHESPVTVLMSPACASFDMFDNYQARGEAFAHAVKEQLQ